MQHDFEFEFLGLADPLRPNVPQALAACYTAGLRVIMITGDYPGTAGSIAAEIGLTPRDALVTGAALDRMADAELRQRIRRVNILSLRALYRSRSCAWWRRSRPTAKSSP